MRSHQCKQWIGDLLHTTNRHFSSVSTFAAPSRSDYRKNLIGMPFEDLATEIATLSNAKRFTPTQIWHHLYRQGKEGVKDTARTNRKLMRPLFFYFRICSV
jgi:hypothetical protein